MVNWNVKKFLLILAYTFGVVSFGQQMKVESGGLIFENKEGTSLNKAVFEACWCDISKEDSLGNPIILKPFTFPVPVKLNNEWKLLSKEGEIINDYTSTVPYIQKGGSIYELNGFYNNNHRWSVDSSSVLEQIDTLGTTTQVYYVQDIHKGTFLLTKDKLSWGMLNSEMKEILPFEYIAAHHENEQFHFSTKGYLSIRKNEVGSLFGAVDYKGKTIIPFKWKLISYVIEDEDHIYVMNEYLKRGYINIKGQTTLNFIYEKIPRILSDSNFVQTKDYVYFLDRNLKQIGPKYGSFERKGDVYFYQKDRKWGVMDLNYKPIIPNIYSSIMDGPRLKGNPDFKCYIVVKNGLYGLVTLEGENIIKPAYECLCGLSYFAPSSYYIEFKKADVSYKFDQDGNLIEKGGVGSKACFCE
ncbi:MAG: hypothetical protein ABJG68_12065 [Crocinitomicaceae bacterium]